MRLKKAILLFFLVASLTGCGPSPTLVAPAVTTPTATAPQMATETSPLPTASLLPAATETLLPPAATPTPTNVPTEASPTAIPVQNTLAPDDPAVREFGQNTIVALAQGDGNYLWAATLGGIVRWDLRTAESTLFAPGDGPAESQSNDLVICPTPQGSRLFVGHEDGTLSIFDPSTATWQQEKAGSNIQSLSCDEAGGQLLAGGSNGLWFLNFATRQWTSIGPKEGLTAGEIRQIHVNGPAIWLAAGEQGGFLVNGNRAVAFAYLAGFPTLPITDLATIEGGAWIAYPGGLVIFRVQDKSLSSYSSSIPFTTIDRVEVANDGTVWIALSSEGVCPLPPRSRYCYTLYPTPEGMLFTDLIAGDPGIAYAGTNGGGILILTPDGVQRLIYQ